MPFSSSEDCDLRNASPQRGRPSLSIWLLRAYLLDLATPSDAVSDIFKGVFRTYLRVSEQEVAGARRMWAVYLAIFRTSHTP